MEPPTPEQAQVYRPDHGHVLWASLGASVKASARDGESAANPVVAERVAALVSASPVRCLLSATPALLRDSADAICDIATAAIVEAWKARPIGGVGAGRYASVVGLVETGGAVSPESKLVEDALEAVELFLYGPAAAAAMIADRVDLVALAAVACSRAAPGRNRRRVTACLVRVLRAMLVAGPSSAAAQDWALMDAFAVAVKATIAICVDGIVDGANGSGGVDDGDECLALLAAMVSLRPGLALTLRAKTELETVGLLYSALVATLEAQTVSALVDGVALLSGLAAVDPQLRESVFGGSNAAASLRLLLAVVADASPGSPSEAAAMRAVDVIAAILDDRARAKAALIDVVAMGSEVARCVATLDCAESDQGFAGVRPSVCRLLALLLNRGLFVDNVAESMDRGRVVALARAALPSTVDPQLSRAAMEALAAAFTAIAHLPATDRDVLTALEGAVSRAGDHADLAAAALASLCGAASQSEETRSALGHAVDVAVLMGGAESVLRRVPSADGDAVLVGVGCLSVMLDLPRLCTWVCTEARCLAAATAAASACARAGSWRGFSPPVVFELAMRCLSGASKVKPGSANGGHGDSRLHDSPPLPLLGTSYLIALAGVGAEGPSSASALAPSHPIDSNHTAVDVSRDLAAAYGGSDGGGGGGGGGGGWRAEARTSGSVTESTANLRRRIKHLEDLAEMRASAAAQADRIADASRARVVVVERQCEELEVMLEAARADAAGAESRATAAEAEVAALQAVASQLDSARSELLEARRDAQAVRDSLADLSDQHGRLQARATALEAKAERLPGLESRLATARAEAKTARVEAETYAAALDAARAAVDEAQAQTTALSEQLGRVTAESVAASASHMADRERLEARLEAQGADLAAAAAANARLEAQSLAEADRAAHLQRLALAIHDMTAAVTGGHLSSSSSLNAGGAEEPVPSNRS